MEDTITDHRIQRLYELTAKDIFTLALYVCGNEAEALSASINAFVDGYDRVTGKKDVPDADMFKLLSIRYLYAEGKKRNAAGNRRQKTLSFERENRETLSEDREALFHKLHLLKYSERFILLLFCCQRMRIDHISRALRLPVFLVTRRLLSAVHKLEGACRSACGSGGA